MTCPSTHKRCFNSRRAAKEAHRKVHNKIRSYFCHHCGHYHATSDIGGKHR